MPRNLNKEYTPTLIQNYIELYLILIFSKKLLRKKAYLYYRLVQFLQLNVLGIYRQFSNQLQLYLFHRISFKYIHRSLKILKNRKADDAVDLTLLQSLLMTKGLEESGAMVTVADMLMTGIETVRFRKTPLITFMIIIMIRNVSQNKH